MTATIQTLLLLLAVLVVVAIVARRFNTAPSILLVTAGILLALTPGLPRIELAPELVLLGILPPLIYLAGVAMSWREFRFNLRPIALLAFGCVVFTACAVAAMAHWLLGMPLAVGFVLGAIVAPPDAAAATAILRQVNLPYRIQKILEGESLLNDASALLIYRVCVGLVAAEHMKVHEFVPSVALALFGSLIAGFLFARVWTQITRRITEAPSAIITQFAGTFMVWIVAEHIGLSGILTIVAYAITIARTAPERTPARLRVASYAVWETVVFVLNVLAFILIGMQLNPIWSGLDDEVRFKYCSFAATILAVVVFARIAWVMPYGALLRALNAHGLLPPHVSPAVPTVERGIIVSWCGMRGIVTLAAAFALPESFPYRDLILLTAFAVVLGTLVVQGLTLRPLILALKFEEDDPVAREAAQARCIAYRAALEAIESDPSEEAEILRLEYRAVLLRAETEPEIGIATSELPADPLRRRAIGAAREALLRMRQFEEIGDDAFHQVEEELDRAELSAQA